MKTAVCKLVSKSPYSQGRHHEEPKLEKEGHDDYEKRTWRQRMHADEMGHIFIPPMAFKNAISEAAKFLSVQIKGKGKSTYTKHFEAGVLVTEGITLNVKRDDVRAEWLFVPADGRRGGPKRVNKCFGIIPEWSGEVSFHIIDETITEEVFKYHLEQAGNFIGIGRFRPRNNGYYGRFNVESVTFQ